MDLGLLPDYNYAAKDRVREMRIDAGEAEMLEILDISDHNMCELFLTMDRSESKKGCSEGETGERRKVHDIHKKMLKFRRKMCWNIR